MGWKNGVQYCQRNVEVTLQDVRHLARGYVDEIPIGTTETIRGIPRKTSFANTSGKSG